MERKKKAPERKENKVWHKGMTNTVGRNEGQKGWQERMTERLTNYWQNRLAERKVRKIWPQITKMDWRKPGQKGWQKGMTEMVTKSNERKVGKKNDRKGFFL
jgi:hypothetical protein